MVDAMAYHMTRGQRHGTCRASCSATWVGLALAHRATKPRLLQSDPSIIKFEIPAGWGGAPRADLLGLELAQLASRGLGAVRIGVALSLPAAARRRQRAAPVRAKSDRALVGQGGTRR